VSGVCEGFNQFQPLESGVRGVFVVLEVLTPSKKKRARKTAGFRGFRVWTAVTRVRGVNSGSGF